MQNYIQINCCKINAIYQGQVIANKNYGEGGHVKSECDRWATDFPALTCCKSRKLSTVSSLFCRRNAGLCLSQRLDILCLFYLVTASNMPISKSLSPV